MPRLGFISDPILVLHDTGLRHPERPDRLRAIHRAFRESGLLTSEAFPQFVIDLTEGGKAELAKADTAVIELPYTPATDDDLRLCHTADHIERIAMICAAGDGIADSGDTPVSTRSDELARKSAGAAISAVDWVLSGRVERCFVATRPPGHHAEPDRAMGFCLYSNIAIAARHALVRRGLQRVAVVDFDVHHGNGTQACLETDPASLFISLHQHPQTCYPGTGFDWEVGVGAGKGFTMNLPLPPSAGEKTYQKAFEDKVLPRLREYRPDLLLLSAGFDAHQDDPLADMQLTDESFSWITRQLVDVADEVCGGRVVSLLEGGYHLPALARSAVRHAIELQR